MKILPKGFSLVELMITVAIIGILAAIAIPSYRDYVLKAKLSNLLSLAQSNQQTIAEYIQLTGDNTCTNFQTNIPAGPNQPKAIFTILDDHLSTIYGDIGTYTSHNGTQCGSAAQMDNFIDGNSLLVGYFAETNSDGSISWTCIYQVAGTINDSSSYPFFSGTNCSPVTFGGTYGGG